MKFKVDEGRRRALDRRLQRQAPEGRLRGGHDHALRRLQRQGPDRSPTARFEIPTAEGMPGSPNEGDTVDIAGWLDGRRKASGTFEEHLEDAIDRLGRPTTTATPACSSGRPRSSTGREASRTHTPRRASASARPTRPSRRWSPIWRIDTGKPSRVVPLPGHYASVVRIDERTGIAFGTDGVGTKMVVAEQRRAVRLDRHRLHRDERQRPDLRRGRADRAARLHPLRRGRPRGLRPDRDRACAGAPSSPASRSPAARSPRSATSSPAGS